MAIEEFNFYEEQNIEPSKLPSEWASIEAQQELDLFLQRNWEQRFVFFDDQNRSSHQQFLSFRKFSSIRTNNYIGTIVFKGKQINIFPKMFRRNRHDLSTSGLTLKKLMNNLVQWLDYCTKIDYPYLSVKADVSNCEDLKDLFITLFIRYLNQAFSRGFYFQYVDEYDDLPYVKGRFRVDKFITNNYPSGKLDKFPCEYSEFEFDNDFNQIIKCVCKSLMQQTFDRNKSDLRKIVTKLADVTDRRCTVSDCKKIRLSKMDGRYRIILSFCKLFLFNKVSSMEIGANESFCFLFPTEMLFEGFIGGFLTSMFGKEAVKLQKSDQCLVDNIKYSGKSYGSAFWMRHDIVCTIKDAVFLMDTKYKMVDRFEDIKDEPDEWKHRLADGVKQVDLYQLTTYAVKKGLQKAYIIYPLFRDEPPESEIPVLEEYHVADKPASLEDVKVVDIYLLRVPFVFGDDVEKTKTTLKTVLESVFK